VLKKAFLAFFNDGLHERSKRKPLKLLDLKSLRSFGGTSMYRLAEACFFNTLLLSEFPEKSGACA